MGRTIWLASFPKSGNTWTRTLISHALKPEPDESNINTLSGTNGIASQRGPFDNQTMIASGLLTIDEIETLRPAVHQNLAEDVAFERSMDDEFDDSPFQKVHDAYTFNAAGESVLGGAKAASLAVLIMRDPRAVAPSLANHLNCSIDDAIAKMADSRFMFANSKRDQSNQLPQRLLSWGGFFESWYDQKDIPVHLIKYEDLSTQPVQVLMGLMEAAGRPITQDVAEHAVTLSDFSRIAAQEAKSGFREAPKGRTFFRQGKADAWREELTEGQIETIEAAHAPVMRRLGYVPITQS